MNLETPTRKTGLPVNNANKAKDLYVLGVCVGASSISTVHLKKPINGTRPEIISHATHSHEGNPRKALLDILGSMDLSSFDRITATGRRFRHYINLSSISEPEAVEYAYRFLKPENTACPAVISAGGETFMVYKLDRYGRIANVVTGNKCASGTGEFLLQQLRRMDVSPGKAAEWRGEENPYNVSGRCSVFCKSDCTHATNKGVDKQRVTAGLCRMMAGKILELLKKVERKNLMLVGGTTRNRMMVEYLQENIDNLIIPEYATCFEALGAALWGAENPAMPFPGIDALISDNSGSFETLPTLSDYRDRVEFKTIQRATAQPGDICILGLDVGSTTTKAVLIRKSDKALLASVYLRTNGDPVGASCNCYKSIMEQLEKPSDITIEGLGVCGSGRQIAGLHAMTDGVINEISAHATAAVFFDHEVDTILEIGGQDAKYTFLTNAVPSDYAMNEACSAGTGSFLEESALETLGVKMENIATVALSGKHPPNFNDQCAAFIASDIKNAIHEGAAREDIVAGLVYSVCMNYSNRVKGNRPVGQKVFMQGGVCYNRAVPLAMAALLGKPIVVPPEPGLMGAFGVALEVNNRIEQGLLPRQTYHLRELANREVVYGKSFICHGGQEQCDRKCAIATIEVEGRKIPFGGACNRYYNLQHSVEHNTTDLNLVDQRQELVFHKFGIASDNPALQHCSKTIGINRSFLTNTYYPLFSVYFAELGWKPVLPEAPAPEGIERRNAAFCFPVELAHGFFQSMLNFQPVPDFLFIPHFKAVPQMNGNTNSQACPLVQGEPYYLQAAWREELETLKQRGIKVFCPVIDMTHGIDAAREPLLELALSEGIDRTKAEEAFARAIEKQNELAAEMLETGKKVLAELESDPERTGVVIFGRPYSGFAPEANMGIPRKLASRGTLVIPMDYLPLDNMPGRRHMYWGTGQRIMAAAQLVKSHPQLFGTFITNFSCGPDSFLLGYFRELMGRKPSLTLELDSHTADAGLETRIEAFLDIVDSCRRLPASRPETDKAEVFTPAKVINQDGTTRVITSQGESIPLHDKRVKILVPSMGRFSSEAMAAAFRAEGINAAALPPPEENELQTGRANTTCKECLPLILTTGALLNYMRYKRRQDEIILYFMATGAGPCRFGQYYVFMEDLIKRNKLHDTAIISLSSEDSYTGMGPQFHLRAWRAAVVGDVMEDIRSMLLANAVDRQAAIELFEKEWEKIIFCFEKDGISGLTQQITDSALALGGIPLKRPCAEVPLIALAGEIYVRRDGLSRQYITEILAEKGFAVKCAPVAEWVHYCDYLLDRGTSAPAPQGFKRLGFYFKRFMMYNTERRIKNAFAKSGLVNADVFDVKKVIKTAQPYISDRLAGEAILTVGSSLQEVASHACGVIAIGPFGCMPNRIAESILNEIMQRKDKLASEQGNQRLREILADVDQLPFLAIESDGSPFPQLINAKLETFCLRAERLHEKIISASNGKHNRLETHSG